MPGKEEYSPQPAEGFDLTEQEHLFYRVTDKRFKALIFHPQTIIHSVELSLNSYGEFLFVIVSRAKGYNREVLTFYGLGFHEPRDRWIQDEWFWYRSSLSPEQFLSQRRVRETIHEREREIRQYTEKAEIQSQRGHLFEVLADMSDDDGASSSLDEGDDFDE